MSREVVRIGIIGLGWPGLNHSRAVNRSKGAALAAACDLNAQRREEYSAEFPATVMYHGYDELLEDDTVDAVIVSLPNFLHFPATLAALEAGKHVLCEKPPTLTTAEIETIRSEASARRLTYAFGRQFRFSAPMQAARKAVKEGRLGKVYYAKSHWLRLRGIPLGVGGWFTDKARAGGGAMIDIGIHALDAAWFLAGCPRPLSVTAQTSAYFAGTLGHDVRFDVDDSGFAFIRFENGFALSLEVSWAMNLAEKVDGPQGWTGAETMNTVLYGDAATLQVKPPLIFSTDPENDHHLLSSPLPDSIEDEEEFPQAGNFTRQMTDFVNAIQQGTPPTNSIGQAVDLMKMLMGIYESGALGREVRLDQS